VVTKGVYWIVRHGSRRVYIGSCGMDRVRSTLAGGSKAPYTRDNVCFCCDDCQLVKGARDPDEYYDLAKRVHRAKGPGRSLFVLFWGGARLRCVRAVLGVLQRLQEPALTRRTG
jgi:hypothetical protein